MSDVKVSSRTQDDEVLSAGESPDFAPVDEKKANVSAGSSQDGVEDGENESIHKPADQNDILTRTLHVQDDPTMNCFTFRTWFLGK